MIYLKRHSKLYYEYTQHITSDPVDSLDLNDVEAVGDFFHKALWKLPSIEPITKAWRKKANMQPGLSTTGITSTITPLVYMNFLRNSIPLKSSINSWRSEGISLNTAGGKIKTSPDGLLKQSSTIAKMVEAEFLGGQKMEIAGSYVEFAERLVLPEYSGLEPDFHQTQAQTRWF